MISEESCDTDDWSYDAEIQLWSQKYIIFDSILQQKTLF